MMRGKAWTVAEEHLVKTLWMQGLDDKAIGQRVDRTAKAIRLRRQDRGWTTPPDPVDKDALRELHAAGHNAREIAYKLGCTHRTAQELLWREGLETRNGRRRKGVV